jgi:hypothetical protein
LNWIPEACTVTFTECPTLDVPLSIEQIAVLQEKADARGVTLEEYVLGVVITEASVVEQAAIHRPVAARRERTARAVAVPMCMWCYEITEIQFVAPWSQPIISSTSSWSIYADPLDSAIVHSRCDIQR